MTKCRKSRHRRDEHSPPPRDMRTRSRHSHSRPSRTRLPTRKLPPPLRRMSARSLNQVQLHTSLLRLQLQPLLMCSLPPRIIDRPLSPSARRAALRPSKWRISVPACSEISTRDLKPVELRSTQHNSGWRLIRQRSRSRSRPQQLRRAPFPALHTLLACRLLRCTRARRPSRASR